MRPTDALPHPEDWQVTTVAKSVEIRRGYSWKKEQERDQPSIDTTPVLRIGNIQGVLDTSDILSLYGVPEKAKTLKKADKGWSILVGSNGNHNRIGNAVYLEDNTNYLFASFLIAVKPNDESHILPSFFYRWLCAYETQARISTSSEGSTGLSNLSHNFFKTMQIAYPKLDEQLSIVNILDAVDTTIECTHTAVEKARRLRRALVQKLLSQGLDPSEPRLNTRFGRFPKHWEITPLREVAEIGSGVTLGQKLDGYATVEVPYLRVANVQDGHLDLREVKKVRVKVSEVKEYLLQAGDVVVTEGGDFDKLGRGTVWEGQFQPCLHQNHIFRIRADRARLDPYFLSALIGSDYGKRYFARVAKRTTNLASINKTQLRAFHVLLPSLDEQKQIVAILAATDKRVGAIEVTLHQLERLKRGVMQDLLTGRVRVHPIVAT